MALGDSYKTKLIIDVTVEASSELRAQYRWENILEKIKYQSGYVKIEVPLQPNWIKVEEVENSDNAPSEQ